MNKELKKTIEGELFSLVTAALTVRNRKAAAEISKTISEHVKSISKKFVKNLPEDKVIKKDKGNKKDKKVVKASKPAAKPSRQSKSTGGKIKPVSSKK
ncbi:MAG: hypothetical protein M3Q95_14235 [Bacteroidota bacterium]|nr:hypothetical protein [Bacteroidota bacterium]